MSYQTIKPGDYIRELREQKEKESKKDDKDKEKKDGEEKVSGKKEKININPTIEEGVAQVRNKLLQAVGASSRMKKQFMKVGEGKIQVEVFEDGPNTLYVRFQGQGLPSSEAKEAFMEIRKQIRKFAAKNKVPLIKAAPKVPEKMKGVEHIVLGKYNENKQMMTLEVQKPKAK